MSKWADADFQIKYHKFGARFWVVNWFVVTLIFFVAPAVWAKVSLLYLVWVSLYANIATEYGGQAAAEASKAAETEGEVDVS